MTLKMSGPWKHPNSGVYWLRRRVPDKLRALVGKREEKFSLGTKDPNEAKRRHAQMLTEIDQRWQNLLAPPPALTERDAHEMAVTIYEQHLSRYRDNPSEQNVWDVEVGAKLWSDPPLPPLPTLGDDAAMVKFLTSFEPNSYKKIEMREFCLQLAQQGLEMRGLPLASDNKKKLARAISSALQNASVALAKFAAGHFDLSPTPNNGVVPTRESSGRVTDAQCVEFQVLFDGWAVEKKPTEKTLYSWKRVIRQLAGYLKHEDAAKVSPEDLLAWKASLIAAGLKTKTIRDGKLAPVRAILQWGVDNRRLKSNAGERVTIDLRSKLVDKKRGYSDEEARKVLVSARVHSEKWFKWIVFLSAYTGARVSEVCQLRVEDVLKQDDIWCVRFVPEAGALKNANSERLVPIHSALIGEGFLRFVTGVPSGPLFKELKPDRFESRGGTGTKMIGKWVRSLGLVDPRLSPSHSWRHRLRTLGRRHDLSTDILDAVTGHQKRTVADSYGEYPIKSLQRELEKIPTIELSVRKSDKDDK